ncbi:MAG: S8 family serine peptidase [Holophagales bacterium]|jgi:thermitase|nr:S8 family serine peptidase [Holophagales bacterium]
MYRSIRKYSFALASLLALAAGGCSTTNPRDGQGADTLPAKDIPAISAPVVKYNFYEPKSEEGLKRDTNYGYLIAKTTPKFKTASFEKMGLKIKSALSANGGVYYRLYKEDNVLGALKSLKTMSGVMYAEPELIRRYRALPIEPIVYDFPDKYVLSEQYGVYATKAIDAWTTYGFGPRRPYVASVDSGVRFNHEDFQDGERGVVKHAFSWFAPGSNSLLADVDFDSFPFESPKPFDYTTHPTVTSTDYAAGGGHGTHTAGTMAAVGNNGKGVAGMCWNVDLISYKGLINTSSGTTGDMFTVYASLWHLVQWKEENKYASVIPVNMSLGGYWASSFEVDMIEYALQNGVMVIAASGNDSQRLTCYPAAYAGVLAVGATDGGDKRALFSNWGPYISVVAPGQGIISTYTNSASTASGNLYGSMSGTSMAAPHVTGLIGYMLTFNPDLKPDQIKTYIEQNADYVDGKTDFSDEYGWGRINVAKTIGAVINDVNNNSAPPSSYVYSPVKIKLDFNGINVYLYQCDQQGKIVNYAGSAISGNSLTTWKEEGVVEIGVAYFNLLRPGYYIAHAWLGDGIGVGGTDVFEVKAGQTAPEMVLSIKEALAIQTLGTQDYKLDGNFCDTVIWFYDSETGQEIVRFDNVLYDTLKIPMPAGPGPYWIRITDADDDDYPGEYALYVTKGETRDGELVLIDYDGTGAWIDPTLLAPGTFANPAGGQKSQQAQSRPNAQEIALDTLYYGRLNGSPGDGGTSGATGHYYKFVVE